MKPHLATKLKTVTIAEAGVHHPSPKSLVAKVGVVWVPACAGMTVFRLAVFVVTVALVGWWQGLKQENSTLQKRLADARGLR